MSEGTGMTRTRTLARHAVELGIAATLAVALTVGVHDAARADTHGAHSGGRGHVAHVEDYGDTDQWVPAWRQTLSRCRPAANPNRWQRAPRRMWGTRVARVHGGRMTVNRATAIRFGDTSTLVGRGCGVARS